MGDNSDTGTGQIASSESVHVSTEPSALTVLAPRALQSQIGLEDPIDEEEADTFVVEFEASDNTKSVVALRVSRGKSHVNLGDPSRTYRRVAGEPRIINSTDSPPSPHNSDSGGRKSVKFSSQANITAKMSGILIPCGNPQQFDDEPGPSVQPKDVLFPKPLGEQPSDNLKSDYNFFKPNQTMENVLAKLQKMKLRMTGIKNNLQQIKVTGMKCNVNPGSGPTVENSVENPTEATENPDVSGSENPTQNVVENSVKVINADEEEPDTKEMSNPTTEKDEAEEEELGLNPTKSQMITKPASESDNSSEPD